MTPLTAEGMSEKLQELYAENDDSLLQQSRNICHDLKGWLEANFTMTAEQQDYLSQVPEKISFAWGAQLASLIIGRLDLDFDYSQEPMRTKQTSIENNSSVIFIPGEAQEISGSGVVTFLPLP